LFARLGYFIYRFRIPVIAVMVAILAGLGIFGFDIARGEHLSQGDLYDPSSQSAAGARLRDQLFGHDHSTDVVVLYTAPAGQTVDDPRFSRAVSDSLNSLPVKYPEAIDRVSLSYWNTSTGLQSPLAADASKKHAVAVIAIKGDGDTAQADNFQKVKNAFAIPGVAVEVGGRQAVAGTIDRTMSNDLRRMELLGIPAVAILLFVIFGGLVAAALPLIVGGLTIVGAWGIVRVLTEFTDVNAFVQSVVTMVGLGLAIDYGLFIVSRFREELAAGQNNANAVRRTMMTAGRTVAMSATIIVASCVGLLLFPQGFLKSLAYGAMATVSLAAITALTVLPALLGMLGHRVDMLGLKWIRKTKTAEEIESGPWGKLTRVVLRHPLKVALPIVIGLLLLIVPVHNIRFGGVSEMLLPPDNPTRVAQQHIDEYFPGHRSNTIDLLIRTDNALDVGTVVDDANRAPGILGQFQPAQSAHGVYDYATQLRGDDNANITPTLRYLRSMPLPAGASVLVTGASALQQDSLAALTDRLPLMIAVAIVVSAVLLFLTFGSVVLPIKAALMSALGLGSTLGILTWIFIDGHGATLLDFTPGPIMAAVLVLIIALIFGLSTDYEVFLLSRIVEERNAGASTEEAIRVGMAHTSRIITAAAAILIVVTGAFGFSDLVMMQYIAYGMIAALILDATLLRMFLVPALMRLLGDRCWWAPAWLKQVQHRVGLAEDSPDRLSL
jgi:RND superfamily putative drug exporter